MVSFEHDQSPRRGAGQSKAVRARTRAMARKPSRVTEPPTLLGMGPYTGVGRRAGMSTRLYYSWSNS